MKKSEQLTEKLINVIVADNHPYSQGRATISALFDCVRDRQLTSALVLLEKRGLTGDTALFLIANLQDLEVAS